MIERLRAFLHGGVASAPEAEFSEGVGPEELRIAACALLLEVAYADDYFSADERRHLRSLVRRHFGLKPEGGGGADRPGRRRAPEEGGPLGLHCPDPGPLLGGPEDGVGGGDVGDWCWPTATWSVGRTTSCGSCRVCWRSSPATSPKRASVTSRRGGKRRRPWPDRTRTHLPPDPTRMHLPPDRTRTPRPPARTAPLPPAPTRTPTPAPVPRAAATRRAAARSGGPHDRLLRSRRRGRLPARGVAGPAREARDGPSPDPHRRPRPAPLGGAGGSAGEKRGKQVREAALHPRRRAPLGGAARFGASSRGTSSFPDRLRRRRGRAEGAGPGSFVSPKAS